MSWVKFENCSMQALAKGMGVTLESLSKVPTKKVEQIYQNFITLKNAEEQFAFDKIAYKLEERKGDE